jgi:hypothetical protein
MELGKIFFSSPCLSEESKQLSGYELIQSWFKGGDKRYLAELLFNFREMNLEMFNFLGVTPRISDVKRDIKLSFRTTNYIGAIPLKSPINGKPMGDFIVYPRYIDSNNNSNEYLKIINLLQGSIQPEFLFNHTLISKDQARPPLFFECVKFIDSLFQAIQTKWHKFSTTEKSYPYPKGSIVWKDYIQHEHDPKMRLIFPCKTNLLSTNHTDNQQLYYVYLFSKEQILGQIVPSSFQIDLRKKIPAIERYFSFMAPKPATHLLIRNADPVVIRKLKEEGNRILNYEISPNKAWRIDFAIVFERYIQHLFYTASKSLGLKFRDNPHIRKMSSNNPSWSLKYLEPDFDIYKDNIAIFADTKYKSHLYNFNSHSDLLIDEHRHDLHQIAAYCAFEESKHKIGMLIYPANTYINNHLRYANPYNATTLDISLFGIPITYANLGSIQSQLTIDLAALVKSQLRITE